MTLVLLWRNGPKLTVVADTLFRANGRDALEVGPKIFPVPVRIRTFGSDAPPNVYPDMGFAFAGHTAAGQVTHALASAGMLNLAGNEGVSPPSVADAAAFYARCASYVVGEMLRHHESAQFLFEGVVFGWEGDAAVAHSFEISIENARPISTVEHMDFSKHGLYAMGQGQQKIQAFIDASWAGGVKASPFDALRSVIDDPDVPSVGGGIQGAVADFNGVALKPIIRVDQSGLGRGGFMGAEMNELGLVGELVPLGVEPIIRVEEQSPEEGTAALNGVADYEGGGKH